ncbi:hypothetical protein Syun_001677 [Stephania yunnanensis]|uniref:Uncharacterized protein n=1 Tax=Stephania yunnanensis TaxID=152371 RepID=A0AAP0Q6I4_9MAGN
MAKSNMDNNLHVEKSDRNHILDRINLIMMGLIFDEVTRWWVEKVSNKDLVGKGGGNNQGGSDDKDELVGQVNDVTAKIGRNVTSGLQSVNKGMNNLLKKANEVGNMAKISRRLMKEFINRLDSVVEE